MSNYVFLTEIPDDPRFGRIKILSDPK